MLPIKTLYFRRGSGGTIAAWASDCDNRGGGVKGRLSIECVEKLKPGYWEDCNIPFALPATSRSPTIKAASGRQRGDRPRQNVAPGHPGRRLGEFGGRLEGRVRGADRARVRLPLHHRRGAVEGRGRVEARRLRPGAVQDHPERTARRTRGREGPTAGMIDRRDKIFDRITG